MRFCEKCGKELKEGDVFCPKCGTSVLFEEKKKKGDNEGLGTASTVLGILSIVFSLLINIFVIPLALVGLILGIVNKAQNGRKVSGIVLNGIAMILSVIVFIGLIVALVLVFDEDINYNEGLPNSAEKEELLGSWNCKEVKNLSKDGYDFSVKLNSDNTFNAGKYKDDKNYIKGSFEYDSEGTKSLGKSYRIYTLELNGEEKYEDGKRKSDDYTDYDFVISKTGKGLNAVLTEEETVYFCNK